ncbi:hypothetical protein [Mycolicibacterium phlei]|uniref:hypothetical protein n=1 Tax=Mycolicibacterium phlei TaxID=1771 RepID=UPI001F2CEDF7|nr:hypothetical protein [Mycolicibacterium phlei]
MTAASVFRTVSGVAAAALLSFGVVACSSGSEETTESTTPATTQAPATKKAPAGQAPATQAPASSSLPMIPNPNGDGTMVPCEGTICTNPNHGAGTDPEDNGGAEMLSPEGDGSVVPCEGTVCTNPNHGAGDDGEDW